MRAVVFATLGLLGSGLSGCVGLGDEQATTQADVVPATAPRLASGAEIVHAATGLRWTGAELEADGSSRCSDGDCERIPFTFELPPDTASAPPGTLEVSIRWDRSWDQDFELSVVDAKGATVAEGAKGWFASTALVEGARPGAYEAVVVATAGEGPYEGIVQLEPAPDKGGPARDLLPDLVTVTPTDLAVEHYSEEMLPGQPLRAAGIRGCDPYEIVEKQARRCLRVSNAIGNLGEGPLEVHLAFDQGVLALGGLGHFVQRIYQSDGTYREQTVGPAAFHAAHGHFHYDGFARFTLASYDPATSTAGDVIRTGHKSGFCFFDIGLLGLGLPHTALPRYADAANCLSTTPDEDWLTGLSPNWYDLYWSDLTDQFVDITGVEDGTYVLCSHANAEQTLMEADPSNDDACVAFQLHGDDVEEIGPA